MYRILRRRHPELEIINAFIKFYSRKSHYEVLNLRRNCTEKEIKEAFIQMSKEYHPDKNKDKNAQQKFVRIVEAYNTLSKRSSRARYDCMTEVRSRPTYPGGYNHHQYNQHSYDTSYSTSYSRANTHKQRQQEAKEPPRDYYGVSGVRKLPNLVIIAICLGLAVVGTMLQVIVIRQAYFANKRKVMDQSKRLGEELDKVRATAQSSTNSIMSVTSGCPLANVSFNFFHYPLTVATLIQYGPKEQTQLLLEKIVQSANPTIATASLGHALASEKK